MQVFIGQRKGPVPACAETWVLRGVEQMWKAEEMAGMVGKLVTLSNLIKPVSKYIEDNDRFLTVAEGIYEHRKMGWLEKVLRCWIEIGDIGLNLCFKM